MTDDHPDREIAVPVPPDYSEAERAAYLTGCRVMADLFGNAADTYRALLTNDDESGDTDDDDDDTTCTECGGDLLSSMGADESEYSPEGYVCPDCEL